MTKEIHYAILVIHLIAGLGLVYLAMNAFKKTKYLRDILAACFTLIVVGDVCNPLHQLQH